MASNSSTLLWGGRFTENMNDFIVVLNESLPVDNVLYEDDIRGLETIQKEWADGKYVIHPAADEDIHTANERRLAELIGPAIAGKLHTGRSRNEQIATDMRIWA
ncbi:argininosuccinate lyase [Fusarium equiseti]|uniref:Argininosuccinate lyase n=1 Tax=Fusarium equiseti TaxID=61235 RepID=A0ABQ8R4Z6_FUSEQ|nr:argininosuccinate lyase [Fusarium equiseti]